MPIHYRPISNDVADEIMTEMPWFVDSCHGGMIRRVFLVLRNLRILGGDLDFRDLWENHKQVFS